MKMRFLALAGLGLVLAGTAQGASLSFSNTDQPTPISQNGVLDLFDSMLGSLNSVTLTLELSGLSLFTLHNTSSQTQSVTAYATIPMYFGSSLGGLNTTLAALAPALTQLETSTGPLNLAPGLTLAVGPLPSSTTIELTNLDPGEFSAAGGGNFALYCENTDAKQLDGGNGTVSLALSTQAACGASIAYAFTPAVSQVAEPASMALIGLGVLGLAAIRRRA